MKGFRTHLAIAALLCAGTLALRAQEFRIFDRTVQVHGAVSQGYLDTNQNNWLTMDTSHGTFEMTDGAINASTSITDKLRIGAQVFDHGYGDLGQGHPELDWADASYRFRRWFGMRGGKVKTVLGLYNDTQDLDFLHPFALLPQSIYPVDMRDSTLAHEGGDVYGDISLKRRMGTLSYTGYAGERHDSMYGGYPYMLLSIPIALSSYGGLQYGADLRWQTPLKGLLAGVSRMNEDITGRGTSTLFGPTPVPYEEHSNQDWINQFYGQYTKGRLETESEWRRYWRNQQVFNGLFNVQTDTRGLYIAGAWRFSKWFQAGSYYSRFTLNEPVNTASPQFANDAGHIYDKAVTARFDLNRFTNLKVEGHFMDGYGIPGQYPSGFYTADNAQGLQPTTNALVIRAGMNF